VVVLGPHASLEGGLESPYQHWKDALQLAAHEVGARQASDAIPGVNVTTSAGKEYLRALPAFQVYQAPEGLDQAEVKRAVVEAIRVRAREILALLMSQKSQAGQ
jgi:hypothetical protein